MTPRLILASSSPRRIELVSRLGIPFIHKSPQNKEQLDTSLSIRKSIEKLSYDKAFEIYQKYPNHIVLGADTVIIFQDEVFGKPHTVACAVAMLEKLQGETHTVLTSVTIISKEKTMTFSSMTEVTFHTMSHQEIKSYVETQEPLDKAGAYTIQNQGSLYIKRIQGDYYTVMGLPIAKVYQVLKNDFKLYE